MDDQPITAQKARTRFNDYALGGIATFLATCLGIYRCYQQFDQPGNEFWISFVSSIVLFVLFVRCVCVCVQMYPLADDSTEREQKHPNANE